MTKLEELHKWMSEVIGAEDSSQDAFLMWERILYKVSELRQQEIAETKEIPTPEARA